MSNISVGDRVRITKDATPSDQDSVHFDGSTNDCLALWGTAEVGDVLTVVKDGDEFWKQSYPDIFLTVTESGESVYLVPGQVEKV